MSNVNEAMEKGSVGRVMLNLLAAILLYIGVIMLIGESESITRLLLTKVIAGVLCYAGYKILMRRENNKNN